LIPLKNTRDLNKGFYLLPRILKQNNGIAVIVCLTIISILVASAFEIHKSMRSHVFSTAMSRDITTLSHMASSGIHAAIALLIKDRKDSDIDTIQENWANPDKVKEYLTAIPFNDGSIEVKITDIRSLIQANAIVLFPEGREANNPQMFLWERFLTYMITEEESFDEIEPRTIITSIKDWLDSGDDDAITGLTGAESDYYQDLEAPYSCRNGPFVHKDELLLVRGVTPDLFNGINGQPGIADYTTVQGMTGKGAGKFTYDGKININTAPLPVLAAILPAENSDLAQEIFDYRNEMSESTYVNDLSDPEWYRNVPGCGDITIDPKLITISSDLFQIKTIATRSNKKLTVISSIKREKDDKTGQWTFRILNWVSK
jgi:general secretion pathway protein K